MIYYVCNKKGNENMIKMKTAERLLTKKVSKRVQIFIGLKIDNKSLSVVLVN